MSRRHFGLRIADCGMLVILVAMMSGAADVTAAVTSFDDIQFWVGAGANRAAIVIDWNGETSTDVSLTWGFRFDGTAYGETMLRAVIAADPRLFAKLGNNPPFGVAVRGIGYDLSDDGEFAVDDGTMFDADGIASSGPSNFTESVDPNDLYAEGWNLSGTWAYGVSNSDPWPTGAWIYSPVGATDRTLVNGSWDSWAFTRNFQPQVFAANPAPAIQPADFDSNGVVDATDFLTWQRGLGLDAPLVRAQGDASADDAVEAADLATWKSQFRAAAAAPIGASIPEPAPTTTCASAMFVLFHLVRQQLLPRSSQRRTQRSQRERRAS